MLCVYFPHLFRVMDELVRQDMATPEYVYLTPVLDISEHSMLKRMWLYPYYVKEGTMEGRKRLVTQMKIVSFLCVCINYDYLQNNKALTISVLNQRCINKIM